MKIYRGMKSFLNSFNFKMLVDGGKNYFSFSPIKVIKVGILRNKKTQIRASIGEEAEAEIGGMTKSDAVR